MISVISALEPNHSEPIEVRGRLETFGSDSSIYCAQSDAAETDNIQGHMFPVVRSLGPWEEKAP